MSGACQRHDSDPRDSGFNDHREEVDRIFEDLLAESLDESVAQAEDYLGQYNRYYQLAPGPQAQPRVPSPPPPPLKGEASS